MKYLKHLLLIAGIHIAVFYYLFLPFFSVSESNGYCIVHKEDSNIKYFFKDEYYIVSGNEAIAVNKNKPYIQQSYLNKFFAKEQCDFNPNYLKYSYYDYVESLRIWRFETDLSK